MDKSRYFADDRERDLSKYHDMTEEELEREIERLEAEEAEKRQKQVIA